VFLDIQADSKTNNQYHDSRNNTIKNSRLVASEAFVSQTNNLTTPRKKYAKYFIVLDNFTVIFNLCD